MKKRFKYLINFAVLTAIFVGLTVSIGEAQQKHKKNIDSYDFTFLPGVPSSGATDFIVLKTDFWLTVRDNIQLDASKFYPSAPNPYLPDGYPVVIMCHGFGDRKETLEDFAKAQASYGYVVYTYSMRGQGLSGGLSNLISSTEAKDLIEFVNYVKNDRVVTGSDTSKVLIMGGSQGGIIPYMAACDGMNVRTIISALVSPEFASSWIENGCIKMTLLWTVEYTPDTARYTPQVDRMSDWIYSAQLDKWDSLAYYLPLNRDFTNRVSMCKVPILLENSWQDMFFNAYGNIKSIPSPVVPINSSTLTAPSRYYFGAVRGHGGDFSLAEDKWHENFFNEWFYYWLFNINNQILLRPLYHYAMTKFPETSGMWTFQHDSSTVWPPAGIGNQNFYFNSGNQLKTTPNTNNNAFVTLTNNVKSGYTMQQIVDDEFTGTRFNTNFKKQNITFETSPLTVNYSMIGTPTMKLDYASNNAVAQYNFQIWEVPASGTAKFVTSVNYTDRKNTVNLRKQKTITGNSHAHIFSAGSKIRIVITNLDTRPNYTFLGTNPYVLPSMRNSANKLFLSSNSYITLPIKSAISLTSPAISINNPDFKLQQNFPNPFNPVTNIKFTIPEKFSGITTIKIYDISGREVANLLNANMTAGEHSVKWDATKFASGIYFYKMTAGDFSEIRKMMLVK